MRLVVFGLFHLPLSSFHSFVLCANLLVYVVASPFFLNYLLTLATFIISIPPIYYCCYILVFQMHSFLALSLYWKIRRNRWLQWASIVYYCAFFHSPYKVLSGQEPLGFFSSEWWRILTAGWSGTVTMPQARTVRSTSVPLSIQRTQLLNFNSSFLNSGEMWFF